ncbi:MAG: hypothetical protein EBZ77_09330, partial [Chitinophagia bacterium]|nr:hypothetical protein [Chitinophagia bacterium]
MTEERSLNFIEEIIEKDIADGLHGGRVHTRFPPEPNGYLHIGHAKSICLNFGLAKRYNGQCNLRFDDTNPTTEETEYVESIQKDIQWLGFQWDNLFFASDYFETLYGYAVQLIEKNCAYVDDSTSEEIAATKGSTSEPGKNSPYRDRTVAENLQLFADMRAGKYADGEKVLRAKIDMKSGNINMRDTGVSSARSPRGPTHQLDATEAFVGRKFENFFERQVGENRADKTESHDVFLPHGHS